MDGHVFLAYDYPVLGAFWTVMWIFLWVMWFMLLFRVIMDIFRDHASSGWVKTGWLLLVLFLPFLGVFIYVIARGKNMARRDMDAAQERQKAMETYIRDAAGGAGGSPAEEVARLAQLKGEGHLSEEEFQRAKQKILG